MPREQVKLITGYSYNIMHIQAMLHSCLLNDGFVRLLDSKQDFFYNERRARCGMPALNGKKKTTQNQRLTFTEELVYFYLLLPP